MRHIQWVRHGEIIDKTKLCGRTDIDILPIKPTRINAMLPFLHTDAPIFSSPAIRALKTAQACLPQSNPSIIDAFWEQDFGDYDGAKFSDIPQLGELSLEDLAAHRSPNGESFLDLCARVAKGIDQLPFGPSIVFAHAGVIRAALGIALGAFERGLAFEVANLSLNETKFFPSAECWSISRVNMVAGI